MGPHDDDADDWGGPPPELVDRVWRHPAEIAAAHRLAAEAERAKRQRRRVVVMTATGGLVLGCGAAVFGAQAFERRPSGVRSGEVALVPVEVAPSTVASVLPLASSAIVEASADSDASTVVSDQVTDDTVASEATSPTDLDDAPVRTLVTPDDVGSLAVVSLGEQAVTCVQVTDDHAAMAMPDVPVEVGMSISGPDGALEVVHIDHRRSIVVLSGRAGDPVDVARIGIGDTVLSLTPEGLRRGEIIDTAARLDGAHGPIEGALLTNITSIEDDHEPVIVDGSGRIVGLTLATDHTLVAALPLEIVVRVVENLEHEAPAVGWTLAVDGDRVVVTGLDNGGPAAAAGIALGDVVEFLDGHAVRSMLDVEAHLREGGDAMEVMIRRDSGAAKLTRHRLQLVLVEPVDASA